MTIVESIQRIAVQKQTPFLEGKVSNVNETKGVCDITPLNGDPIIYDCYFSVLGGGFQVVPKDKSVVLVGLTEEHYGHILLASDVEKIVYKKGFNEVEIDPEKGLKLKSSGLDLSSVMESFVKENSSILDTIVAMQVLTPQGPGTVSPATITKLQAHKGKLNTILEQFKKLLYG